MRLIKINLVVALKAAALVQEKRKNKNTLKTDTPVLYTLPSAEQKGLAS